MQLAGADNEAVKISAKRFRLFLLLFQVVMIGTGGSKFADIAVDDISLIKGTCDRRAGMYCLIALILTLMINV